MLLPPPLLPLPPAAAMQPVEDTAASARSTPYGGAESGGDSEGDDSEMMWGRLLPDPAGATAGGIDDSCGGRAGGGGGEGPGPSDAAAATGWLEGQTAAEDPAEWEGEWEL